MTLDRKEMKFWTLKLFERNLYALFGCADAAIAKLNLAGMFIFPVLGLVAEKTVIKILISRNLTSLLG